MADYNAFDSATSTDLLFCNEETKAFCFDDNDDYHVLQPSTHQNIAEKDLIFSNGASDSEALLHLPCLSEECIGYMLEREREHLPRDDYLARLRNGELDVGLRREALDWMFKACAHFSFGELCLYSAISYFDRFLSIYELPLSSSEKGSKNWAVQLVAVACLSLAAKIEEVNVPSTLDLQAGVPKLLFEGKTIQRMEILVLNSLNWKIKAYTPCNFIDYYLRKMNEGGEPLGLVISRSLRLIMSTIEGIEFLEFKPSEIAAAVAMCVSGEMQAMDIDKALSCLIGVEKERVVKCLEIIQDSSSSMSGASTTTTTSTITTTVAARVAMANVAPRSPNGVLDAACLSYKSDETTVGSCPSSSHTSPVTKRRKLDKATTFLGGDS
ncbi:cyclin-D4-2-like [Salvia miltiorrhiza]|uniref:cyclin-D4-2-like n=1 Tax=Salvia miltiorrhiza TaxID=226208 RepID=UPI0025AB6083|nr:cyclin-D4-2-like [Salvia miltiorrhiza]